MLKNVIEMPEFQDPKACKIMNYHAGETILHEGEESLDVYYILSGKVQIQKRIVLYDGRHLQSSVTELGENETFGELNLFDGAPRSASVVAANDVKLARINRDVLIKYLDQHPAEAYLLFRGWLQRLARDLRSSNDRSSSLFAWGLHQHGVDKGL